LETKTSYRNSTPSVVAVKVSPALRPEQPVRIKAYRIEVTIPTQIFGIEVFIISYCLVTLQSYPVLHINIGQKGPIVGINGF